VEEDVSSDDVITDNDDDVIDFPGGPDDEVDFDFLIDAKDLSSIGEKISKPWSKLVAPSPPSPQPQPPPQDMLMSPSLLQMLHQPHVPYQSYLQEVPLPLVYRLATFPPTTVKHPPTLCSGVPGLRTFARVCLEVYNVNLQTKHICVRLVGVLDLKIHKFKVHLKIACFRIPLIEAERVAQMLESRDLHVASLAETRSTNETTVYEVEFIHELFDLTKNLDLTNDVTEKMTSEDKVIDLFRSLQVQDDNETYMFTSRRKNNGKDPGALSFKR
ncbi:hypothetical protein MAR_002893, partial [Mya arenaria]